MKEVVFKMEKYKYLKTSDKSNLMELSCIISSTENIINEMALCKPQEKSLIKTLKTGQTYIKKGLKEMTGAMNRAQLEDVMKYTEKKEVIIVEKGIARIMTNKVTLRDEEIAVELKEVDNMFKDVKLKICSNCDGLYDYSICHFQKLMISTGQEGKENYINCPFEGK